MREELVGVAVKTPQRLGFLGELRTRFSKGGTVGWTGTGWSVELRDFIELWVGVLDYKRNFPEVSK